MLVGRPGGPGGARPGGEGGDRGVSRSRGPSAHQRVGERPGPWSGRGLEAAGERHAPRPERAGTGQARHHTGQDGGDRPHGPGGGESEDDRLVGAVEQPGDREGGGHMGRRHGRAHMVPGGPAARRRRGVPGMTHGAGPGVRGAGRPGQGEVQRGLGRAGAPDDHRQGRAAAREGPGGDELNGGEDRDQPPRHRLVGDRVVAQSRKHAAEEGQHTRAHARTGTHRPRTRAPAAVRPHVIT